MALHQIRKAHRPPTELEHCLNTAGLHSVLAASERAAPGVTHTPRFSVRAQVRLLCTLQLQDCCLQAGDQLSFSARSGQVPHLVSRLCAASGKDTNICWTSRSSTSCISWLLVAQDSPVSCHMPQKNNDCPSLLCNSKTTVVGATRSNTTDAHAAQPEEYPTISCSSETVAIGTTSPGVTCAHPTEHGEIPKYTLPL